MIKQIFLSSSHARLRYSVALLLSALIIILGSLPGARADIGRVASGLVLHSIAYAVLTFLIFTGSSGSPIRRAIKAVLTIAVMGAVDEIVQSNFPYRHGAVSDWVVDCSAALVTAFVMWALWTRYRVQT